jgi:hypothetical protein
MRAMRISRGNAALAGVAAALLGVLPVAASPTAEATAVTGTSRPVSSVTWIAQELTFGVPTVSATARLVPRPGNYSNLTAVYCTSAGNCWAVGYVGKTGGGTQVVVNQVLHWNGQQWSKVRAPNPGGTGNNDASELFGIRCTSPANCWAVGSYTATGKGIDQVLHWNGRRWSKVAAPSRGGRILASVSCVSASDCWAVGVTIKTSAGSTVILNQALHWNGRKWSTVSVPSPAGTAPLDDSELGSIRCTSASSCWAVGQYGTDGPIVLFNQVLHWNGRRWSKFAAPSPGATGLGDFNRLNGLSCTSPINCWAVGQYGTVTAPETLLNQALHWNGHRWSVVTTPDPDGTGGGAVNGLNDVSCTSETSCWAVGSYGSVTGGGVGTVLNEALRWDGGNWSVVATPDPGGTSDTDVNILSGVRCTSARYCWAVGGWAQPNAEPVNQALNWNGRRWISG